MCLTRLLMTNKCKSTLKEGDVFKIVPIVSMLRACNDISFINCVPISENFT